MERKRTKILDMSQIIKSDKQLAWSWTTCGTAVNVQSVEHFEIGFFHRDDVVFRAHSVVLHGLRIKIQQLQLTAWYSIALVFNHL